MILREKLLKMTRLCLIFCVVLTIAVIAQERERGEERNMSEELSLSRLVRSPDAGKIRKMKKEKKKEQRKGAKNRRTKSVSRTNSRAVSDLCFEQVVTIMKMWKDVISNFEKQKKRMEKQNATAGNKSGKKSLFGSIAQMLVEVGGGNKSAPSCGGSTTNDGAKQLANLTSTLDSCKDDIHKACDPSNIPQPNMTFIMMCDDLVTQFKAGAMACLNKSVGGFKTTATDACTCWTNTDLAAIVTKAKMCKASDEAKAISAALKTCTAAFGKCRKFEDDANTAITACGSDSSKLTAKVIFLL